MRISDWSSDVCSSDLLLWLVTLVWALQRRPQAAPQRDGRAEPSKAGAGLRDLKRVLDSGDFGEVANVLCAMADPPAADLDAMRERLARSEEHTSELQSLMRISYAVFCLKKKKKP